MKRRVYLIGMVLSLSLASFSYADSSSKGRAIESVETYYDFDCGLLTGLLFTVRQLNVLPPIRARDVDGWVALFEINRGRKQQLEIDIKIASKVLKNRKLAARLSKEVLEGYENYIEHTSGNAQHFADIVWDQWDLFAKTLVRLKSIQEEACNGFKK